MPGEGQGGAGILLGGVPGVPPGEVVVLGGGVVGTNAARMALGLEADVTVIDRSLPRLARTGRCIRPAREHRFRHLRRDRACGAGRGSGHRRRAGARRGGAQAGDARDARDDAAGLGAGRCRDRPGRLLRDQPADHALDPTYVVGRRRALLRGEHAGRGGAHLDASR